MLQWLLTNILDTWDAVAKGCQGRDTAKYGDAAVLTDGHSLHSGVSHKAHAYILLAENTLIA